MKFEFIVPAIVIAIVIFRVIAKAVNQEPSHGDGTDSDFELKKDAPKAGISQNKFTLQPGQEFVSLDGQKIEMIKYKISDEALEEIDKSRLQIFSSEIYEFYPCSAEEKSCISKQEYYNRNIFFWRTSEQFEKRSLPEKFRTLPVKHFISSEFMPESFPVGSGTVVPWFDQPGGGIKFFFGNQGQELEIPEIARRKWIHYVKHLDPSQINRNSLDDDQHIILFDKQVIQFYRGEFYLRGKPIPLNLGLSLGYIGIFKKGDSVEQQTIKI